jgi:hypothetical protein
MRQALHIFKKDARHLWMEIAVVLLATGLLVLTSTHQQYWLQSARLPQNIAAMLVSYLLPIAWWVLIVRAIHGETLVGDEEFWPTRPYSWKSLLGAKALLIVLFLNLPMLIAQAVILQAHGFSLAAEIPGLLWNQVLLTLVFVLPFAAIAAVTTGMVQFLLIVLVAFAVLTALAMRFMMFATTIVGGGWPAMEWIHIYYSLLVIAIAATAILLWQYAQRRTLPNRILAVAAVAVLAIGAPVSWNTAFALQSRFSRQPIAGSAIRAGFQTNFQWMTRALIERGHRVSLNIPLQIAGISDDVTAKPEGLTVTIEGPGGAVWRAEDEPWSNVASTGQLVALRTVIDEAFYEKVKDQPVNFRGYLFLTLYGHRQVTKVPFVDRLQPVPGLGICSATGGWGAPYFLTCNSDFHPRAYLISVRFEEEAHEQDGRYTARRLASYSPFPAELSLNPVNPYVSYSTYKGALDGVTVSALEPIAHVRAPLAIDGLKLGAYEARLK